MCWCDDELSKLQVSHWLEYSLKERIEATVTVAIDEMYSIGVMDAAFI